MEPATEAAAAEGCAFGEPPLSTQRPCLTHAVHQRRQIQEAQVTRLAAAGPPRVTRQVDGADATSWQTLSEELAEFMGSKEARRSEVVKRLWEHIKANNLMVRCLAFSPPCAKSSCPSLGQTGKTIACDAVLKARAVVRSLVRVADPHSRRSSTANERTCSR